MGTSIQLSDEALRAIAQAVWDKFNEPLIRGVKPKCLCGHCASRFAKAIWLLQAVCDKEEMAQIKAAATSSNGSVSRLLNMASFRFAIALVCEEQQQRSDH